MSNKFTTDPKAENTSGGNHLGGTKFGQAPEATEGNKAKLEGKRKSLVTEAAEHEVKMNEAKKKAEPDDIDYRPSPPRSSPD